MSSSVHTWCTDEVSVLHTVIVVLGLGVLPDSISIDCVVAGHYIFIPFVYDWSCSRIHMSNLQLATMTVAVILICNKYSTNSIESYDFDTQCRSSYLQQLTRDLNRRETFGVHYFLPSRLMLQVLANGPDTHIINKISSTIVVVLLQC